MMHFLMVGKEFALVNELAKSDKLEDAE